MASNKNTTILLKKIMAIAGLIWFIYIIFHLISVLTFYGGEQLYNSFYIWLRSSWIYPVLLILLIMTIVFHIYVAVIRQIKNNKSAGVKYKKNHPAIIPRWIVWSSASLIFVFIIVHSVQMLSVESKDLYATTVSVLSNPMMLVLYGLGIFAIGAHLQHGLANVLNTLGISSVKHSKISYFISIVLIVGYASIILFIIIL